MFHFPLILHEYRRLQRQSLEMIWAQGQSGLMIFLFAYLQQNILKSTPLLGLSYFWLSQGFCLFFLSDRFYKQDLHNGFYGNVLSSSTSLNLFLGYRSLLFIAMITLWSFLLSPFFLWLLQIPLALFFHIAVLLLLFNACIGVYGGAMALLMPTSKSYLLPFIMLPFLFPIFIFTIQGCNIHLFRTSICFLTGHFFISFPILLFIAHLNIKKAIINNL